jgi:hypothetical protein
MYERGQPESSIFAEIGDFGLTAWGAVEKVVISAVFRGVFEGKAAANGARARRKFFADNEN